MTFLANEGTFAVLGMTIALIVALAGVSALGAYVLYCDRKNRLGESDLAGATEESAHLHQERPTPLQSHALRESPADSVAPRPEVGAPSEATAPPPAGPRPARPPQDR